MNIIGKLLETVETFGDRELVREKEHRWHLAELVRMAEAFGALIAEADRSRFKNVAILLPNSVGFVISYFAILFAGRTVVPLNCLLKPPELANLLTDCEAEVLITSQMCRPVVEALCALIKKQFKVFYVEEVLCSNTLRHLQGGDSWKQISADDVACLLYTSGTVGQPKGVMLTHRNLLSNVTSCQRWLEVSPEDSFLCVLPMFHSFGMTTCFLLPLLCGSSIWILPAYNPAMLLDLLGRENITALILVPPWFHLLLEAARSRTAQLKTVRICISGGGPLPAQLETAFPRVFKLPLYNGYGLTEASPVVSANRPQDYKPGSIGKPIPEVSVAIWKSSQPDIATPSVEPRLSAGEVGEIMVRGPNVMQGYFRLPQETAQTISPDGWLHTGDLGYLDADGFLYITGRKKELIVVCGKNVYPCEVELVLMEYPGVAEAAVVGESDPDRGRGEQVVAYIRLQEGVSVSEKELRHHCAQRLADYKLPRRYVFVNELPKNTLGKIQKFLLHQ
ncbi:MAG: AMP-binding protein [Candidatus Sumerlaeia bacterium]|nr:AMP-binding protein [Candidatus Sumerlaeia bacterium]